LLALLEADERCVVATPVIIDGVNGERFHWPRRWPFLLARLPRVFALLGALNSLYPTSGALVRTHAAATTAFPDADGGDDWVFGVSLAFRGRVALDPQPGRLYRRHADSVSAGWRTADVLRHAALVRRRVRSDPAVPAAVRFIAPCFALVHCFILCVLRPAARRTTRRRRTRA
jgi:hypothetical protein